MKWSLLLISDLHYGTQPNGVIGMRDPERFNLNHIQKLQKENNLQVIVAAGDLTDHGYDGKRCCLLPKKYNDGNVDEFGAFIDDFVLPIDANGHIELLLGPGNHDSYSKFPYLHKPVFKYIKNRYDSTYNHINFNKSNCYSRKINGVTFISMGIYPKNLSFLRKALPENYTDPIVIFFHYNVLLAEKYSDWWSVSEKAEFYATIKKHNIIGVLHGHIHATSSKTWMDIPIFNGSSPTGPLLITFEDQTIVSAVKQHVNEM